MIVSKLAQFMAISSGTMKDDKGTDFTYYKIVVTDDDMITDGNKFRQFPVKQIEIERLKLNDKEVAKSYVGKMVEMTGREQENYNKRTLKWSIQFRVEKLKFNA